jgi:hypothetical protein
LDWSQPHDYLKKQPQPQQSSSQPLKVWSARWFIHIELSGPSGTCQKSLVKLPQSRFWTYRNLPAAKSLPAKKRGMCVDKVTTQREEFFDDHI